MSPVEQTPEQTSLSKVTPKEQGDEASRVVMIELAPRIEELWQRWQTGVYSAESRIPLAGDVVLSKPFQDSHAAWQCLVRASASASGGSAIVMPGGVVALTQTVC
jgi:hypothetical protein